jgi:hypothetical protein
MQDVIINPARLPIPISTHPARLWVSHEEAQKTAKTDPAGFLTTDNTKPPGSSLPIVIVRRSRQGATDAAIPPVGTMAISDGLPRQPDGPPRNDNRRFEA